MSPATTTTPPGTKANILRDVAGEKYPKLALGWIAARYHLTMADLQAILGRHGYPDPVQMRRHADQLIEQAATERAHPQSDGAAVGDSRWDVFPGPDEAGAGRYISIPVAQLHPDPDNPRDELRDIDDLADSILEAGLLQPLVVRRQHGRIYVVAGHRRLAAVKKLGWTDVHCILKDIRAGNVVAAMLIENGQRTDLDPIEEARGLRHLKAMETLTDHELAKRVGRSQPTVSARLALLSLSAEEQAEIRAGTMSLVEATAKGRLTSGKVRKTGADRNWHLGPHHDLAQQAKARCLRLKHSRGRTVGGMACGECWESVIRADERDHLHEISAHLGKCALCDRPNESTYLEEATAP